MMKFKTVREGEQAIILNHLGEGRLIIGPSRVSRVAPGENHVIAAPSSRAKCGHPVGGLSHYWVFHG